MKHPSYLLLLLCCASLALASTTRADEKSEIHYPLVLIHGFLASGDTYEQQALRFVANGFDMDRIFTFDWNTVGRQGNMTALSEMVDAVLEKTGADKIYLAGHSAGSGLSYSFMADSNRAQLVEAYAHLAGRPMEELPGVASHRVRPLNIYSDGDYIVKGNDISGAENLRLTKQDHYEVATSEETFAAMFAFFTGEKPQQLTVPHAENEHIQLSGKVLSLGENQIQAGAKVVVYALKTNSGERQQETPAGEFTVDDHGHWGPFTANKGIAYEFVVSPKEEDSRSIHYYRTPFYTDNPFIYLRTLPGAGSMAGMLLSGIPSDDAQSAVAIFASQQAIIHGRDRLSINETELSTEDWAKPSSSNIAWFLYDANNNLESDFTAIPTFAMMPFLMGVDVFFPTKPVATQSAAFNDQHLYFLNRKSETEGIVVLVF